MDMHLAVSDTFERSVAHPLTSSLERLAIQRDASSSRMVGVTNLERRVNHLDASMVHHINVTLSDIKRDELDRFCHDLQQDIISEIRVETSKYDKVEGGIVRRFELVAGEIAKNFHKEGASRRSSIEMMRRKVDGKALEQTQHLQETLSRIANLRARLRQERADRQARDSELAETIVARTATARRAILALLSDDEDL